MAQGDTITIQDNGDGTYSVQVQEAQGDADDGQDAGDQPQTVSSVKDVLKLVQQELTEGSNPQAAWQAEAAQRDPTSGQRQPGGASPIQSM